MAQIQFTLTQEEYEALIALAREGTKDSEGRVASDKALRLDEFLRAIEKRNGVERHIIWLQWQELDEPLPPGTRFPEKWPPDKRAYVEQVTRPISKADLQEVLDANAKNPISVLFTRDPGALYGWTEFDQYT